MDRIEKRLPTVDEYLALREAVGWRVPTAGEALSALQNSAFGVVATSGGGAIGAGRVVGDGTFYAFAVDLIVVPEHQGRGVGRRLLLALEEGVRDRSATGVLQLVADRDVAPFYERCGYERSESGVFLKRLSS